MLSLEEKLIKYHINLSKHSTESHWYAFTRKVKPHGVTDHNVTGATPTEVVDKIIEMIEG